MEKNLQAIHHLDKDEPASSFKELYDAGARFQARADGGSDVFWPSGPSDLAVVETIRQELLQRKSAEVSVDQIQIRE